MTRTLLSRLINLAFLFSITVSLVGCGGAEVKIVDQSSSAAHAVSGKDQLKARLTEIANSGSGGSAVSGMQDGLMELKKTDDALATQLLKDLSVLENLQEAAEIKALAAKMADKLK